MMNYKTADELKNAWLEFYNIDSIEFIESLKYNDETTRLSKKDYKTLVDNLKVYRSELNTSICEKDFNEFNEEQLDELESRLSTVYNCFLYVILQANCSKDELEEIVKDI